MAMSDLAMHSSDKPVRLSEISARQDISLSFLEQLFGKMRKAGLVDSVRGARGGYLLSKAAHETAVLDVLAAVGEGIETTRCEVGALAGCTGKSTKCLTHDLWSALGEHIESFLAGVTVQDVIERNIEVAA